MFKNLSFRIFNHRYSLYPIYNSSFYYSSSFSKQSLKEGPDLKDFLTENIKQENYDIESINPPPYLINHSQGEGRKVLIETYGCQMNYSDTEIINSVLKSSGYEQTNVDKDADIVLLNTCAIRENAEGKIWNRLSQLRSLKRKKRINITVGVLGCMAERLKHKLLESDKLCDIVVGPDSYRDLPNLLAKVGNGEQAINVILSHDETYADITPVRPSDNLVSAYVSIMRGCNNMCSYCIVPFTRGRERSRDIDSILYEVQQLSEQGYKEIVLLGQNVNSYNDLSKKTEESQVEMADGFKSIVKVPSGGMRFAELLDKVSKVDPEMRIRFTSPHPKDFPDRVLHLIKERHNICCSLHMPAQSGSTKVLQSMRRGHTREAYLELVHKARKIIPNVSISSDFISGFCGETEEDHQQTLSLLKEVEYEMAFMFAYSLREKTHAHRALNDDVDPSVKQRRLSEVIDLFYSLAIAKNEQELHKNHIILIEKDARRGEDNLIGRTDTNKKVIIPKKNIPISLYNNTNTTTIPKPGDYVSVDIIKTGFTLHGEPKAITTLQEYYNVN